jgi:hypothetical protein
MGDSHAVLSQHVKSNRENSERLQKPCNPEMMSGLTLTRARRRLHSFLASEPRLVEMTRIGSLRSVNRPLLTTMLSKAITPVVLRGLNLHVSLTTLKGVVTIGADSKAACKWSGQSMLTLRDSLRSMKPTEREPSKILDRVDSLIDELLNDSDLSSSSLASILMAARESVRDGYHVALARRTWDAHNDLKLRDCPGESNRPEARLGD